MDKFIEVKNISKYFSGVTALENINLTINKGEIRTLVGQNGSGKTTLIKIISGVYQKSKGELFIEGQKYQELKPIEAIQKGIQIIYQDFSLFPDLTVAENIALSQEIAKGNKVINWNKIKSIANEAISKINFEIDINKNLEELSIADKQLVAISRALLYDAKLIVMDEPTTTLTRNEVNKLFKVIRDLKEKGISILFVSHKLNEVFEISEKITILRDGKKVYDGKAEDLDREKVEHYMTGKKLKSIESFNYKKGENKKQLMRVEALSKEDSYENINFSLFDGEIIGITGLLGCGRTDLALSLFGLSSIDSGNIFINNKNIKIKNPRIAINNNIGYVPEDRLREGLVLNKSVGENIASAIIDNLVLKYNFIDNNEYETIVDYWIEKMDIKTPSRRIPTDSLSGGNQQRVLLAKWLATSPNILILNSPTVGVDVGSKSAIHKYLRQFVKDKNKAVILISDDIPEIINNCNRILLMKKGEISEKFDQNKESINENELYQKLIGK